MKILVCVASRHGATYEIGRAISDELSCVLARQRALATVDLVHVQQVTGLDEYDVVVIGSAVYMDHWIRAAHEFTTTRQRELASKQVWLFSSGPIGEPPRPAARTRDVDELMMLTGARQHQVFGGRLDKQLLTFGEKAIVRLIGAASGDYRDWPAIKSWATDIALVLRESGAAAAPRCLIDGGAD